MAYGGLRGAVSFSLVEMLLPSVIKPRQMFVTTTLAVILFTVFVQVKFLSFFLPSFQSIGSRRTNRLSPPLIRAALSSSLSGSCTFKRTARPSSTS